MPRRPRLTIGSPAGALKRYGLSVLAASILLVAGCGDDEEPELTFEDRLNLLEPRPLTPAEVADRAEVGATLCRLDDRVLDAIWFRLDDDQLAFQDIVFSTLCPERAVLYAGHTGRYVTEEAELSGVVTSTSRPTGPTIASPTSAADRPDPTVGSTTSTAPLGSTAPSTSSTSASTSPESTSSTLPATSVTTSLGSTTTSTTRASR